MSSEYKEGYLSFRRCASNLIDLSEGIGSPLRGEEIVYAIKLARSAYAFLADFADINSLSLYELIDLAENNRIDFFEDSIIGFNEAFDK